MNKYIIRNCPAILRMTKICDAYDTTRDLPQFCKDRTDCVLKQIVELCKQRIQFCENCHKTADIAIDCVECDERGEANISRCILKLLDIEEVE